MNLITLLKKPSAFIPLLLSLTALGELLTYVAVFGIASQPQADEGAAARIFQLLIVLQIPVIIYFAVRWLPKFSRPALQVLALQGIAAAAAILAVIIAES